MRYNPLELEYELIELFDQQVIYVDLRVDRKLIPEFLCSYEVRHAPDGDPCELNENIIVDFLGTIISKKPFKIPKDGLIIDPDETFRHIEGGFTLSKYIDY